MDDLQGMKSYTGKMTQVYLRAKFVGEEGERGYKKGTHYQGRVKGNTFYPDDRTAKPCPYSVAGFLVNWADIQIGQHREIPI